MGCVDGVLGVPGEAERDHHVPLSAAEQLLKDLTGGAGLHQRHVFKDHLHIKIQVTSQMGRGPRAQNIDMPGVDDLLHSRLKGVPVLVHGDLP